jgi:CrcB protein
LGGVARTALAELGPSDPTAWPWSTALVNVVGAFLLAYFATRLQERLPLSSYRRPLLGTGLCGALTTFSTLQLELLRMLDAGALRLAAAYATVSLFGGLLAVFAAQALTRRVRLL